MESICGCRRSCQWFANVITPLIIPCCPPPNSLLAPVLSGLISTCLKCNRYHKFFFFLAMEYTLKSSINTGLRRIIRHDPNVFPHVIAAALLLAA